MEKPTFLEQELAPVFTEKAPFQLPDDIREIIVKIIPYLIIVQIVFFVLSMLGGGSVILAAFSANLLYSISALISLAGAIIGMLALPGSFKRTRESWVKMYQAQLLFVLASLVTLTISGFISGLFSLAVGLFLLFQIRPKYVN
ncbi:hypothetical protein J2I47_23755 [Fibrella sp. HMF5335]|uniref:Chromate transporter n=1 Tax=Fibrella rubiginis TaxID=2817060 RepID=A0A939GJQ6_9BACT|nr:hypothetical protein [Fibrella rubiginis]MBO0939586.1 hypothetical protein [Fibrella rubiginis]